MRLPSILTKKTLETEPSDVSRRWPTGPGSEKGSEDGLVNKQERAGFGETSSSGVYGLKWLMQRQQLQGTPSELHL